MLPNYLKKKNKQHEIWQIEEEIREVMGGLVDRVVEDASEKVMEEEDLTQRFEETMGKIQKREEE